MRSRLLKKELIDEKNLTGAIKKMGLSLHWKKTTAFSVVFFLVSQQ
jgi:hypothetical protein